MNRKLYCLLLATLFAGKMSAQCATSYAPSNDCSSYGDEIDYFELDAVAASGNSGCGSNGYNIFTSPVWNLTLGNTYTWTCDVGNGTENEGVSIWIDLDGDGFYGTTEMVDVSSPATTHNGSFTIPFTASPGSREMRVRCAYYTTMTSSDACVDYIGTWGETEDYTVNLISPTPCSGTPGANSVVGPTAAICPNSAVLLSLLNTYTVGDITYQWQASTSSSVGPYTSVTNGNNSSYQTPPLNVPTWYQVIITCTISSGVTTATPGVVLVQPTTTNTVPYFEGFEGISKDNELPNCSWTAQNINSQAYTNITAKSDGRQPCSGNKFASFYYSPAGTKNFYTNGIWLNAGVTYSASLWYKTEYYGYANWTNLSILAGPSQNATGQFTIASTNGPAVSAICKSLSNTFAVNQSGLYYVNVRATSQTSQYAYYLSWDDLSIIVPCGLNVPNVVVTGSNSICEGEPLALSATGANSFTWSTGSTGSVLNDLPFTSMDYYVIGTSTASGCSAKVNYPVTVNPVPNVNIFPDKTAVCEGKSVVLTAFGADTYLWNNTSTSNVITVNPTASTTYQVYGTNSYGCIAMAQQAITVYANPAVNGSADRTQICTGEAVYLTGTGGVTYSWVSPFGYIQNNPAKSYPTTSTTYTVTGKDANGCTNTAQVTVAVDACVGIAEQSGSNGSKVFPNPNNGIFTVQAAGKTEVVVSDISGRTVASANGEDNLELDISSLANGIYQIRVITGRGAEVIRIVKE